MASGRGGEGQLHPVETFFMPYGKRTREGTAAPDRLNHDRTVSVVRGCERKHCRTFRLAHRSGGRSRGLMGCVVWRLGVFTTSRHRTGEYDALTETGRILITAKWLAEQRNTRPPLAGDDLRQQRAVSGRGGTVWVRGRCIRLSECPFSDGGWKRPLAGDDLRQQQAESGSGGLVRVGGRRIRLLGCPFFLQ